MLADVLRLVSEEHSLPYLPREAPDAELSHLHAPPPDLASWPAAELAAIDPAAANVADVSDAATTTHAAAARTPPPPFAHGTSFVELSSPPAEAALTALFDRLRCLFEWHSPSADDTDQGAVPSSRKPLDSQMLPGPRWKLPSFLRFLCEHPGAPAVPRADAEAVFASICGKGGAMDLIDFAEALALLARRRYGLPPLREPPLPSSKGSASGGASPKPLHEKKNRADRAGHDRANNGRTAHSPQQQHGGGKPKPRPRAAAASPSAPDGGGRATTAGGTASAKAGARPPAALEALGAMAPAELLLRLLDEMDDVDEALPKQRASPTPGERDSSSEGSLMVLRAPRARPAAESSPAPG